MMGAARIGDKKVPTLVINGLTGKDWFAWRILPLIGLGYRGRCYMFRKVIRTYKFTNERLASDPFAVSLPGGMAYRLLDVAGNHKSVYEE